MITRSWEISARRRDSASLVAELEATEAAEELMRRAVMAHLAGPDPRAAPRQLFELASRGLCLEGFGSLLALAAAALRRGQAASPRAAVVTAEALMARADAQAAIGPCDERLVEELVRYVGCLAGGVRLPVQRVGGAAGEDLLAAAFVVAVAAVAHVADETAAVLDDLLAPGEVASAG